MGVAGQESASGRTLGLGFNSGDGVIVTGGASGIGLATAELAAELGLHVAIWDRDGDVAEDAADRLRSEGRRAVAAKVDVSEEGEVQQALQATRSLGTFPYLVNNAGPANFAPLEFLEAMRLTVASVRTVTEGWLAGDLPRHAAVVNVASIAGTSIAVASDWYATAKAGISGYTTHLAGHRCDEVRANAVAPGFTDTPRTRAMAERYPEASSKAVARIPLGRAGQPEEVAAAICFLLSPLASFINGVTLRVDGGAVIAG